ncbi:MAG TPA: hypothetical protein PLG63_02380 [bacterium]|nr:hypothetical protein [bacterium]
MIKEKTFHEVKRLWKSGYTKTWISKHLNISYKTVLKHLKHKVYPGYRITKPRKSKLDPYREYMEARLKGNNIKVAELFEEIKEQGYKGSQATLYDFIKELENKSKHRANIKTPKILPGKYMSCHLRSYRKVLKDGNDGGDKMAGKRADFAFCEYRKMYKAASKHEKGCILDEFCKLTRYHRKYATELLGKDDTGIKVVKKRSTVYSREALFVIERIWEMADYPWSERLVVQIPLWLPSAKQHMKWITPEIEKEVRNVSARQIDRRLQNKKIKLKRKMYGRTKPGTLLKHHIPIKTDNWDVSEPGFTEADLVSHSGSNASGVFINSLSMTDILTGWVETVPILGKTEAATLNGIEEAIKALPFPIKGIDTDNGSEFINEHLFDYCNHHDIQFTRGRPYKKNDNAHIEQKNWTHVRKIIGYERYDSQEHLAAMHDLYRRKLRLMMNLFQPCVKLKHKERIGSKIKKSYEMPATPLDRLISYYKEQNLPIPLTVTRLIQLRENTDPFKLSKDISSAVKNIQNMKSNAEKKVV